MRTFLIASLLCFLQPPHAQEAPRIVSLGSSVTEILYALGVQDQIVAVDSGSQFPEAAKSLPKVGYVRTLSAEGLLSLQPKLIIGTTEAGPPQTLAYLREAGVDCLIVPEEHSLEGVEKKITAIGGRLGRTDEAQALVQQLQEAKGKLAALPATQPKVVFVSSRGANGMMAAGTDTAAHAMLTLAGAKNVADTYKGYKPLSAEYLTVAEPDVIVTGKRTLETSGGLKAFLKHPALENTPAGKNKRVVALDDIYLLGFGPRAGQAALELSEAIRK
jgi:iron complex transport system substrate-binding protein